MSRNRYAMRIADGPHTGHAYSSNGANITRVGMEKAFSITPKTPHFGKCLKACISLVDGSIARYYY